MKHLIENISCLLAGILTAILLSFVFLVCLDFQDRIENGEPRQQAFNKAIGCWTFRSDCK